MRSSSSHEPAVCRWAIGGSRFSSASCRLRRSNVNASVSSANTGASIARFCRTRWTCIARLADWLMEEGRVRRSAQRAATVEDAGVVRLRATIGRFRRTRCTYGVRSHAAQSVCGCGGCGRCNGRHDRAPRSAGRSGAAEYQRTSAARRPARATTRCRQASCTAYPRVDCNGATTRQADAVCIVSAHADPRCGAWARHGPGTTIAVYLLTDTHLRILIATSRGQNDLRVDVDGAALRRDIGRYLDGITRRRKTSLRWAARCMKRWCGP